MKKHAIQSRLTALLLAAEKLGAECCECAFLGDSGMDMAAAKSAGMFPVGVLWGFREREELERNHADAIAVDPLELLKFIE